MSVKHKGILTSLDGASLRALACLFAALFISYRLFLFQTGFYNDDWVILVKIMGTEGFWEKFWAFCGYKHFWTRPVEIPLFAFQYWITGVQARPEAGQLFLFFLEALESLLFFSLIAKVSGSKRFAFMAAFFMSIFPSRAIMHVWMTLTPQPMSHILILVSFLLHWRWLDGRDKKSDLLLGQMFYIAAVLCYESTTLLPVMLGGALVSRELKRGWGRALRHSVGSMAPYIVSLAVVFGWQHVGAKVVLGWSNPKDIEFTLSHFFRAFGAGFECVTNRVIHACALSVRPALDHFGPALWALWVVLVFTAGKAAFAWKAFPESEPVRGREAGVFILAAFLGAYAPYALSGNYMPAMFGIMSRTNGSGAWVGGLLLAWLFETLKKRASGPGFGRGASVLAALIFGLFTLANWHAMWEYARSWKIQTSVLERLAPRVGPIAGRPRVLLDGVPRNFGKAVVFDATYDFDYALKIATGRKDVYGKLISPQTTFEEKGVVIRDYGAVMSYPYENLFLYDYRSDRFERLGPPEK